MGGPINVGDNGSLLSGSNLSRVANGTEAATITVQLRDENGNDISQENVQVSFATTLGNLSSPTATTNASGLATVTLTSTDIGTAEVTASITDPNTGAVTNGSPVMVVFGAGAATRLVVEGSSTQTAGSSQSISITARDASGNVVSTYEGDKTLTFFGAGNAPNGTKPTIRNKNGSLVEFGEATTIAFTNGVASVTGVNNGVMTLYLAETANIGVNDGSINSAEGDRLKVTVSSASAHSIVIAGGDGQTATAGSTLSTAPTVSVTDTYGNPVSGREVTFAVTSGGGSLSGTNPATSGANGIATAPEWTLGPSAGTNVMTATANGLANSPLTFTATGEAGNATKIVFKQQPTNTVSTQNFNPVVTVEFLDSNDNQVQSTNNVTIGIGTNPGSGTLSGTLTRSAVNGVATFSGLSIDKVGTGYTLSASSGSFNVTSNSFNITSGAASLDYTTAVVPDGEAGSSTSITITVKDAGENPLTGQAGLLSVALTEDSPNHGVTFSSITDNGDGTYTVSYTPTKPGDDRITISLNGDALNGSPFTSKVSAGAVANFLVEKSGGGNIAEQTAGESFSLRIVARDAQGNTVTGFTGTVNLSLNKNSFESGGGTTGNFVNGVLSSHSVQINSADTGYQITATQNGAGDSAPTGTSNSFNVIAASGNKIVILTQPVGGASGSTLATQPVIEVQDNLNNRVTSFTGAVTVSIHSGDDGTLTGTTTVNAESGVVTYSDLVLAGLVSQSYVLRFTGSGLASANANAITITPGVATRLAITGSSSQIAGTSQNLTITAYDSKGNVSTGYGGDKNLTFSGANQSPSGTNPTVTNKDGSATNFGTALAVTFTDGVATASSGNNGEMTLYAAGSSTIAVQDQDEIAAAGDDRLTVTVTHGPLESFAVSLSSPQTNGSSFSETNNITARDSWGNTVTNFNASTTPVTLTTSLNGTISGLGSAENNVLNRAGDFSNGVANLTGNFVYTGAPGTGTFTATADGKTGTSSDVTIIDDTEIATNVDVPGGKVGDVTTITITLSNQDGEPVVGAAGRLNVGITGANEGVVISGITDNGDGTYTVTYTPITAGEDQISIQLDGDPVAGSPFTSLVLPDDDEMILSFLQSPNASTEAGFQIGTIIVEALDSEGNRITGFTGEVSINITEGTGGPLATDAILIGTTTVNAVNGVATFASIVMERAGINYTLTATADEFTDGISAPFEVTPGPPWQLSIRE